MPSKKPSRILASLVFPKTGPVRLNSEQLAFTNDDLELQIVQKLTRAIHEQYKVGLASPERAARGEEPIDVWCRTERGERLGLQLVEAADAQGGVVERLRKRYQDALNADVELATALTGFHVDIVASEDERHLPDPRRSKPCVEELTSALLGMASQLSTLQPGKKRVRKVTLANGCDVHFLLWHRDRTPRIWWTGGRVFLPEDDRNLITAAVSKKLRKHYSTGEPLWLVVYGIGVGAIANEEDLIAARALLNASDSLFDEAWFFAPMANQDTGHAIRIWKRDEASGLGPNGA